uniref:MARVEL domain-containing protein n=1 Tax=Otus sunia TaxID=257818 RepID=A0A8C8AER3_9STRI
MNASKENYLKAACAVLNWDLAAAPRVRSPGGHDRPLETAAPQAGPRAQRRGAGHRRERRRTRRQRSCRSDTEPWRSRVSRAAWSGHHVPRWFRGVRMALGRHVPLLREERLERPGLGFRRPRSGRTEVRKGRRLQPRGMQNPPPGGCCCRAVEALLAGLILLCGSVSGGSAGGYTGLPGLGGLYYYQYGGAYSGFSGADGERVQQLDQRFHRLKLPVARAAMAVAGTLMAFSCLLIAAGVLHLPGRFPAWLLLECVLDTVTAIGIVPALYCFFHFLLGVYNSSVCRERERLYQSKGYQGFGCSLHGAEIAAGLLGCVAAIAHLLSAGLAVREYRAARKWKQKSCYKCCYLWERSHSYSPLLLPNSFL